MDTKIKNLEPIIAQDLDELKERLTGKKLPENLSVNEQLSGQLQELFEVRNPLLKHDSQYTILQKEFIDQNKEMLGKYIYFPWSGNVIHMLNEVEYNELRTNRNKNLITGEEQKKLQESCIGVVGLSIGSHIAVTLVYQGIGRKMKLAEYDTLETTNLNRIRAGVHHVGLPKAVVVAQQIYEINPYADLEFFADGLTRENLKHFVCDNPPRVIFEVIDDFEMKILLRLEAKKAKIPVVMFSNLGDSILIDIERYDLDPQPQLFNGVLGDVPEKILANPNEDKNKYAIAMVGKENIPRRALESVEQIHKTLMGRPQLANTVVIDGALGAFIARRIILSQPLPSRRSRFSIEDLLI